MKQFRKGLCLLLSLLLTLCFAVSLAQPAFAAAYFETNADGWHYRYYYSGYIELGYYCGSSEHVTIPSKIGAVPVLGFCEGNPYFYTVMAADSNIKSISFDLQLTTLPEYFAANCLNLETVTLPDSLTSISAKAFYNCMKLSAINIPSGVKTIGESAFEYCEALQSVTLPSALKTVGSNAFGRCYALSSLTFNDGLQTIGESAFSGDTSLTEVSLPDSVLTIGRNAFGDCRALRSARLPEGLSVIPPRLFDRCINLETVDIPASVTTIQDHAFYDCAKLDPVTLPAGLRILEDSAFELCTSLTSISIPGGVSNIGAEAFCGCTSLQDVTIGYGVFSIGESESTTDGPGSNGGSFANCCGVGGSMTITLPISVNYIYEESFSENAVKYLDGEKPYYDRIEFSSESDRANFHYRVPVSFSTAYGEAPATVYPYTGETITLPGVAATGYTFAQWIRKSAGDAYHPNSHFIVGNSPETFTASWNANINTVTFVTGKEGVTVPSQSVLSGNCATMPQVPCVNDEYVEGWYFDLQNPSDPGTINDDIPFDFDTPITEDLTLYARWKAATPVTVNITGETAMSGIIIFYSADTGTQVATLWQSGTVMVPADAIMKIIILDAVSFAGSIIAQVPAGNGAYYSYTTNIVNGTDSYQPGFGESATVEITFHNTPVVTVNASSDPRPVVDEFGNPIVDDFGHVFTTTNADGLWTLVDGYGNTYVNGDYVNVPEGEVVPTDANLTLTLDPPDGFGCDGTILNGDREIPVYDGQTTYSCMPIGAVTLNLHFYSRANYVTLYFRNTETDSFFSQTYSKSEDTFTTPECPYSSSHAVFWNWSATV
ncbi:MAG: leucine-rich repeat protein, partial [Clostridia bacterium]|nr:leucine-rich repeat protein [Clostridia bacterium]